MFQQNPTIVRDNRSLAQIQAERQAVDQKRAAALAAGATELPVRALETDLHYCEWCSQYVTANHSHVS